MGREPSVGGQGYCRAVPREVHKEPALYVDKRILNEGPQSVDSVGSGTPEEDCLVEEWSQILNNTLVPSTSFTHLRRNVIPPSPLLGAGGV